MERGSLWLKWNFLMSMYLSGPGLREAYVCTLKSVHAGQARNESAPFAMTYLHDRLELLLVRWGHQGDRFVIIL